MRPLVELGESFRPAFIAGTGVARVGVLLPHATVSIGSDIESVSRKGDVGVVAWQARVDVG